MSKLEGIGLENEQIGQIQVALFGRGLLDPEITAVNGLYSRRMGDAVELRDGRLPVV